MDGDRELVQGWFRVVEQEVGVFQIEEPLHDERVKSYLIVGGRRAVLLDSGMGVGDIRALVRGLIDRPITLVLSHAHWDHVGGAAAFRDQGEILVHEAAVEDLGRGVPNRRLRGFLTRERLRGPLPAGFDLETAAIDGVEPTATLRDGDEIDLGDRALEVLATPGHAPGLISLLDRRRGALFSTDAAYAGALYAHLPGADLATYRATMSRLAALAPSLRAVYPAHGDSPIDPALLPSMRDALDAVAAGRPADGVADGVATHRFPGFSVLVTAGGSGVGVR